MMRIRLLIACKDERRGLTLSGHFTQEPSNGIASHTTQLATLAGAIAAGRPDVLVLEHALCGEQPANRVVPALRQLSPATRILLLCEACSHELLGHTVKTHLHHIYAKLHQSGRYKAVLSQRHGVPASQEYAAEKLSCRA
jgi:hypothetical protein